jgi:hypothetical protein
LTVQQGKDACEKRILRLLVWFPSWGTEYRGGGRGGGYVGAGEHFPAFPGFQSSEALGTTSLRAHPTERLPTETNRDQNHPLDSLRTLNFETKAVPGGDRHGDPLGFFVQ